MKFKEIQEITEKMDWEMRVDAIEEFVMFHLPLADYYVYLCDTTPDETIADLRFHAEEFDPENYLLRPYDRSKAAVDKANYIKASLMNLSAELTKKAEEMDEEEEEGLPWDEDDAFDDPKLRNAIIKIADNLIRYTNEMDTYKRYSFWMPLLEGTQLSVSEAKELFQNLIDTNRN